MACFAVESSAGLQAAQQQRAAAALAQRLQAACVTIASHEMAAAEFKRYFQELQDRNTQLGALTRCYPENGFLNPSLFRGSRQTPSSRIASSSFDLVKAANLSTFTVTPSMSSLPVSLQRGSLARGNRQTLDTLCSLTSSASQRCAPRQRLLC